MLATRYRPAHVVVFPQDVAMDQVSDAALISFPWLRDASGSIGAWDIADLVGTVAATSDTRIGAATASDVLILFTGDGAAGDRDQPREASLAGMVADLLPTLATSATLSPPIAMGDTSSSRRAAAAR